MDRPALSMGRTASTRRRPSKPTPRGYRGPATRSALPGRRGSGVAAGDGFAKVFERESLCVEQAAVLDLTTKSFETRRAASL